MAWRPGLCRPLLDQFHFEEQGLCKDTEKRVPPCRRNPVSVQGRAASAKPWANM